MLDYSVIQVWLLLFARMASFIFIAPFFSMQGIPALLKVGFSFLLSVIIYPIVNYVPLGELTPGVWWFMVIKEVAVGLAMGFLAGMIFSAIRIAGELIDIQMGFAMASVLDPQTQFRTTLMGQFKYLVAMLVFIALDGHHVLIAALAHSYSVVPIAGADVQPVLGLFFLKVFIGMFALAFKIAAPIIAVLVISDISLGLIARTVPQLNVFILGFPLKAGLGMVTVALVLPLFVVVIGYLISQMERDLISVLEYFLP
ncbi:MAG: flagellar biosynthetic protein FliR [Bacillota bacterium]